MKIAILSLYTEAHGKLDQIMDESKEGFAAY